MIRAMRLLAIVGILVAMTGCRRNAQDGTAGSGPATTQPGSAAEQSRGPRQGAAAAGCRDLPSADDLKKWLAQAPSESEAGGLMSGKMEWAAVVDRAGHVCATAVATEDPASAWPGSQA